MKRQCIEVFSNIFSMLVGFVVGDIRAKYALHSEDSTIYFQDDIW